MRLVALSLIWEFWVRCRWGLAAAALGTALIPILLLALLANQNAIEPGGRGLEMLHFVWVGCEALALVSAIIGSRRRGAHLALLPIPTAELTFWQLFLPVIGTAGAFLAVAAGINQLFDVDWPLWGPALFVGVSCALAQTGFWIGGRSVVLQLLCVTLFESLWFLWLHSQYGRLTGAPEHYWSQVVPADILTANLVLLASFVLSVPAVARDRRGDAPNLLWLRRILDNWISRNRAEAVIPGTPARAQFWFEWTQKGLMLPFLVVLFCLFFLTIWVWEGAPREKLRDGFDFIGLALCIVSLIVGLIFGHCGRTDGDPKYGGFLASRPITDTALALSVLQTAGRSVLTSWGMWAVTRSVLLASIAPTQFRPLTEEFWLHAGVLFGAWTAAALPTCASLTGRAKVCLALILGVCGLLIGQAVFVRLVVPNHLRMPFDRGFAYFDALLAVALSVGLFAAALRLRLLGVLPVLVVAASWAALVGIVGSALLASFAEIKLGMMMFFVLLTCGVALALVPIAAAPLAVSWNRHR